MVRLMRQYLAARLGVGGHRGTQGRRAALCVVALSTLIFAASAIATTTAPHVATDRDTDACAMCHRAHTSASDTTRTVPGRAEETTRSALIVGVFTGAADTGLCYVCHGVEALGSGTDVQSEFTAASAHSIAPAPSEHGPSPKKCSSCHDSHGIERTPSGDPYPALLRVYESADSTRAFYTGDEYCAACHLARPESRWDGLQVWRRTAHATEMTAPASGTGIICSNCHAAHGSEIAPLITTRLLPPAAPATLTVEANDRQLCLGCHADKLATYSGRVAYDVSGHAVSEATMTVVGEWPSAESSRTVGECQNCHAPMGRSDGGGGVIPKLAEKRGRAMCDTCHSSESTVGALAGDLAQFKFPPSEAPKLEVAVAYNAGRLPAVYDRLALYAQETTGTLPFDLVGPREYDVPGAMVDMAAGDIRGLGVNQLLIADPTAKRLAVATPDALAGVGVSTYSITTTPTLVAIGDVFLDGSGRPEVVVVSRSTETTGNSTLWVYRWDALNESLEEIVGGIALDDDASGLAAGRLTRADRDDIGVTAFSGPSVSVYSESISVPGTLSDPPTRRYTAVDGVRAGPRGLSIGDASAGTAGSEIAVANSLEATYTLSLFNPTTGLVGSYPTTGAASAAGAVAWDTVIADVLPGIVGTETVVALRNDNGMSGINVFEQLGASGFVVSYDTGQHFATSALAFGDVDSAADGRAELVVANAGTWSQTVAGNHVPPSVQVFRVSPSGTALLAPVTYSAGGVEKAGNTPAVVVADLGALGATRHPTSVSSDPIALSTVHVSTETAPFDLHVECTDCHNVHEATSTPTPAVASAPDVYGRLKGAWGVETEYVSASTIAYTQREGVLYEYEVCFKCHSGWTRAPGGADDIAAQFSTHNTSFHLIKTGSTPASNTAGSFVPATPAWTTSSVLHCVDCHGNSDATQPAGPHTSRAAPLLSRPMWGVTPAETEGLCYRCHKYEVYFTGTEDLVPASTSNFYDPVLVEPKLHKLHVKDAGLSCQSCHFPHGVTDHEHMIRPDLDWTHSAGGGACSTACHLGGTHVYVR